MDYLELEFGSCVGRLAKGVLWTEIMVKRRFFPASIPDNRFNLNGLCPVPVERVPQVLQIGEVYSTRAHHHQIQTR
jgi:hypothetical protein